MKINTKHRQIIWNQEDAICSTEWSLDNKTMIRSIPVFYGTIAHAMGHALKFQLPNKQIAYIDKNEYYSALLQHANLDPDSEPLKEKMDAIVESFLRRGPIALCTQNGSYFPRATDLSTELLTELSPPHRRHRWMQTIRSFHHRNTRVVTSADDVNNKLGQELAYAQTHMLSQQENPHFTYVPLPGRASTSIPKPRFIEKHEVGIASAQGLRAQMEDKYLADKFFVHLLNGTNHQAEFFAVLDGHGGVEAVSYVQKHLKKKLQEAFNKMAGVERLSDTAIWNALKLTFVALSEECRDLNLRSGTTATVAIILEGNLWVANVGDSRALLQDPINGTRQLSEDFAATTQRNIESIKKRGGFLFGNKVPSNSSHSFLTVGRSIGSGMNPRPKIVKIPLSQISDGSFLVLGTDGIFGSDRYPLASSTQIGRIIEDKASQIPLQHLAEDVLCSAFKAGSQDNLTLMIVRLKTI